MAPLKKGKVVAFVPVRGGSKSIPFKNIKSIAGKPLVQWVLEAAARAKCVDEIVVATDSVDIARSVEALNLIKVRVVGRSVETATATASTESALVEFCRSEDFEHVYLIQATSPLLTSADLDSAWQLYRCSEYRSIVSVVRQKRFVWDRVNGIGTPVNYSPEKRPRRQEFDGFLVENGAFYLSSRRDILAGACRITDPVGLHEMAEESYFEIDEPSDWIVVEEILRHRDAESSVVPSTSIRMFVMDCDGVLTDAGMYYSSSGEELKKFNTRDGKGIELLRTAGIRTAIVTGEKSEPVVRRAEKLKIDDVFLGVQNKDLVLNELAQKYGLGLGEFAYIGDDINDLPAIKLCGFTACPSDADFQVKQAVDVVLDRKGGQAAVRAFVDLILGNEV